MNEAAVALTLLAGATLIFGVAALVWLAMGLALRTTLRVCLALAGTNLLLACSIAADSLRHSLPGIWTSWGSDLAAIAAFALLHQAIAGIDKDGRHAWRAGLAVGLPAAVALLLEPYGEARLWHPAIVFATLGLLAGMSAWQAFVRLRQQVKAHVALLTASPLFVVAALLLLRLAEILQAPPQPLTLQAGTPFNLAWLWSMVVLSLVLNCTMAFLLLMRTILSIQRLTMHDPLTDVLNRRALSEAIEREHLQRLRGVPYALVMLDMDRFKRLNDTHGHGAGDTALLALVAALKPCIREVDQLGRLGGEEFCALLPDTDLAGAFLVAERMRANLEATDFCWKGESWPLSASFGIAQATADDLSAEDVLRRADRAMYQSKSQGRNLVQAVEG